MDKMSRYIEPQKLIEFISQHFEFMSIENQRYGLMISGLIHSDIKDAVIVLKPERMEILLMELGINELCDWVQIGSNIALQRGT